MKSLTEDQSLDLHVDPSGAEPIYRQLRRAVIDAVSRGRLSPGDEMPSSRSLATTLGVSRSTVNLTYQELVAEGFLVARDRVGYIVHPDLPQPAIGGTDNDKLALPPNWAERCVDFDDYLVHLRKRPGRHTATYPFVVGAPDPRLFPVAAWQRAMRQATADDHLPAMIFDHIDTDDPMLVELICRDVLPARGIEATQDNVLLTMGTQHGLHLVASALVRPGDKVGVEDPGYPDAAHILKRAGADLVPSTVDDQGVRIVDDALSMVVVTPGHHYPTNVTLSAARRHQLLARAQEQDLLIVEDDHNSELRHRGHSIAALKSLDTTDRVIYLGSFSKYFGPGLRLGYVVASAPLISKLRDIRRYSIRHPPGLMTRTMALFIDNGDYEKGMRAVTTALRDRWEIAVSAVTSGLDWDIDFPAGGASLWLRGPDDFDATALVQEAAEHGLVVESGAACFLSDPVPNNTLRIGLSGIATDRIEPGITLLTDLIKGQQGRRK